MVRQFFSGFGGVAVLVSAGMGCGGGGGALIADHDGGLVLTPIDASTSVTADAHVDETTSDATSDAPPSRFITSVVSFTPGACAGFIGPGGMPRVVYGPPVGYGSSEGSTDVVSLGKGGEIVVSFAPNAIMDGPGVDFIVFENPFVEDGTTFLYAEPGEVSVSNDLETWSTFPCTQTTQDAPYGQCAGVNPVFSNPDNDISPFDTAHAGGDAYDLASLGVTQARYVRIRNIVTSETCPAGYDKYGFDLDAIAIVNPALR
jgi:hypothetical protein